MSTRPMRRKEREMDREFCLDLIDNAEYGTLALFDGAEPYSVPLSIVRIGDNLYFHSARAGRKVDILKEHPRVAVSFVGKVQVPDLYTKEEIDEIAADPKLAVQLIKDVFTTEFDSVMAEGICYKTEDREEKAKVLEAIAKKYTPDKMKYFPTAVEVGLDYTAIYRIEVDRLTGKRKKKQREL